MASRVESVVRALWRSEGAYHGYTACFGCGEFAHCCGISALLRVCVVCFEFKFQCRHPRRRLADVA